MNWLIHQLAKRGDGRPKRASKQAGKRLCPLIVTAGLTVLTLGPSHDQVVLEVHSNIKRLFGRPDFGPRLAVSSYCAVSPRDRLALFPKRRGCFAAGVARQPSMTRLLEVGDNHRGAFTICP
jgi:hypothetical protein